MNKIAKVALIGGGAFLALSLIGSVSSSEQQFGGAGLGYQGGSLDTPKKESSAPVYNISFPDSSGVFSSPSSSSPSQVSKKSSSSKSSGNVGLASGFGTPVLLKKDSSGQVQGSSFGGVQLNRDDTLKAVLGGGTPAFRSGFTSNLMGVY